MRGRGPARIDWPVDLSQNIATTNTEIDHPGDSHPINLLIALSALSNLSLPSKNPVVENAGLTSTMESHPMVLRHLHEFR
jgi:hypothetical protein